MTDHVDGVCQPHTGVRAVWAAHSLPAAWSAGPLSILTLHTFTAHFAYHTDVQICGSRLYIYNSYHSFSNNDIQTILSFLSG